MNIKKITLLAAAGICTIAGVLSLNDSPKERYFPRVNENSIGQSQLHNGYADYMESIRNNRVTGEIGVAEYQQALKQASKLRKGDKTLDLNWRFKGPDNVGGRTRALIMDKNDTNHIIAGSVSGGLWESFDAAVSWQPYDSDFKISNVSCITQGADGTFYVGTGSSFDGTNNSKAMGSEFVGSGLYKLTGNGNSQLLVSPNTPLVYDFGWSVIDRVAADPNNSQRLFAAMRSGLRESTDGGLTWTNPLGINSSCQDVKITTDGKIVASLGNRIYVSTDNGVTYTSTTINSANRIELAIAPSNTNIMYAAIARGNSCLLGVYQSSDAGSTWNIIENTPNYMSNSFSCQGNYDNAIIVFPNDAGRIIVGAIDLLQWRQSSVDPAPLAGEWKSIAVTSDFSGNGSRSPFYVHADVHTFLFHPTNDNKLYIGSDGGIGFSGNIKSNFPFYGQYNLGYNVTQFYDIGVGPQDYVVGGSQDNGTQLIGMNFNTGKSGVEVGGGDGFDAELFTINPTLGIGALYFGNIYRIQGIGNSLTNSNFDVASIFSGTLATLCNDGFGCANPFYTAFAKWESFNSKATKDSVLVIFDSTLIPPISEFQRDANGNVLTYVNENGSTVPLRTLIPFKSKNNSIPLIDSLRADLFPRDTQNVDEPFFDTLKIGFGVNGKATFITAYDTISIDTIAKTITFNYRGKPSEVRNFTFGVRQNYTNVFYTDGPLSVVVNKTEAIYVNPKISFKYAVEFPDVVQSYVALTNVKGRAVGNTERNIWLSKDIQKGGNVNEPLWIKITGTTSTPTPAPRANFGGADAICATFSNDGNSLFYGTNGGDLFRVDNINDIDVSTFTPTTPDDFAVNNIVSHRKIGDFGNRAVTSIAIDPRNSNNIVVTLGNYGQARYVSRSTNALSNLPTYEIISGGGTNALPTAPVYEAVIDYRDSNRVYVATELGVFATENAFETNTIIDGGITIPDVIWTEENTGLGRVPVHSMTQMTFGFNEGAINQGKIYIGTHSRGIFESDKFVGLPGNDLTASGKNSPKNELKVYPNPSKNNLNVELKLYSRNAVVIEVYTLTGQKVKVENYRQPVMGKSTITLDLSELTNGSYIIRAIQNNQVTTTKFIKQ